MRVFTILLLLFGVVSLSAQQNISGRVVSEDGIGLSSVMVVNTQDNGKTYTDKEGYFIISANLGDELRFIRNRYYRGSQSIESSNFITIQLIRMPEDIEEVQISSIKLTGDLNTDSKLLTKKDKMEEVQANLDVPPPPEKPRETPPPTTKEVGVLGFALSNLNFNNLYKNISGDARRMRSLYKYEDLQENIGWVLDSFGVEYFVKSGIPENKVTAFINFSFSENPEVLKYVKRENVGGVMIEMEKTLPKFLERIEQK